MRLNWSIVVASIFLSSVAMAQAPQGQPPFWVSLMPILVIFAIMYFLMLRPQIKKAKAEQQFVAQLKRGDEVITKSGILGRIEGITDQVVTLEIANGTRIKILRSMIGAYTASLTAAAASGATGETKT